MLVYKVVVYFRKRKKKKNGSKWRRKGVGGRWEKGQGKEKVGRGGGGQKKEGDGSGQGRGEKVSKSGGRGPEGTREFGGESLLNVLEIGKNQGREKNGFEEEGTPGKILPGRIQEEVYHS